METVKQLIKKKESKAVIAYKKQKAKEEKERRAEKRKAVRDDINHIIWNAEYHCFSINSSNEEVAEYIHKYGRHSHYITYDVDMECSFPIKSKVFNYWKQAIESKFGININIYRKSSYRFDPSGPCSDRISIVMEVAVKE